MWTENEHEKNKDHGRKHDNSHMAVYVNGIQLDQVEGYVYLGQRFTLIENCEGYTTNMLKKKGLQPIHSSSNDIWSRDLDINNIKWKRNCLQHNTTWNETCSTSLIKTEKLTIG